MLRFLTSPFIYITGVVVIWIFAWLVLRGYRLNAELDDLLKERRAAREEALRIERIRERKEAERIEREGLRDAAE